MTQSRTPVVPKRTSNLSMLLRQTATRLPDVTALVRGEVVWTWAELDARVDALAAAYVEVGLGPGDVIMLHAPNSRDYLTVLFAAGSISPLLVTDDTHDIVSTGRL